MKRLPPWFKVRLQNNKEYKEVRSVLREGRLHTVCEEARCPNQFECWGNKTATFMILGDKCTRNCRFCAVESGTPGGVDDDEPKRVAEAVLKLGIEYAVITSVTRDDLPDGGARLFAETIKEIREKCKGCKIEVLIPDLAGSHEALKKVMDAGPDVLNHNVETVPSLYEKVRPGASFERSVTLLKRSKDAGLKTKSGIMTGLGEKWEELISLFNVLSGAGCDILSIGQYLKPGSGNFEIEKFYTPEEFDLLAEKARECGISHVISSPLTRSSYHASKHG